MWWNIHLNKQKFEDSDRLGADKETDGETYK